MKILNILCINGASFYKQLHTEYYTILLQLLQYYKDVQNDNTTNLVLKNFTPQIVEIPNVDINLQPIHVVVKDINTCKTLIELILLLLSESIPPSLLDNNKIDLEEKVFTQLLFAVENFGVDIKYACLTFFLNLIQNMNKESIVKFNSCFPIIYRKLLSCIETIVQAMGVLYEKSEVNNLMLSDFNEIFLKFMKIISTGVDVEVRKTLIAICSTVLSKNVDVIFNTEVKLYCLSLSSKLEFPQNLLDITDMDASEIENVSDCYCNQIVKHIQANATDKQVDLYENWYYKQVMSVIASLQLDGNLTNHHLGRCYASLSILENVSTETKRLVNDNCKLIEKQVILTIWSSLTHLIKDNKNILIGNETTRNLIMNIVLSTINLIETMTSEDVNTTLQILCFQNNPQFTENNFACFNDETRLKVLKYLLIGNIYLKNKTNDTWKKTITFVYSTAMKNKDSHTSMEVNINNIDNLVFFFKLRN